ncbi:uncharacterized protein NECHADRAFT_76160 [Fusarium vanettenii 77-13-4]|uniref:Uncharacterized protein n=1 Tax=Fusarium vanettenii (strain ATCC MYA-4622 / CBS 123669 / FGSC 9596 / NRRL 45880 / 77-13-4) TaxID=660122 RepID=C7Z6N3_FUSV7|nr:uncharacterized protein NECHADRAFT_76160 [Fusarium vanettenii 77-13-4]EEU40164.1 predicted protein [Fusarium vanettenii 77-13-4]
MSSSDITNWLSRVVTGRDTPGRTQPNRGAGRNSEDEGEDVPAVGAIRLDDRPDNYYLRSTYPPSEDEGAAPSLPSRQTDSSPGLIFTPSSSSRASTNNTQVNLEERRRQRLGRRFDEQTQTTRELSQQPEPSIHEEILRREEVERALQAARRDLGAIHENVGSIVDHITLVVEAVKKARKEATEENMDSALSEVLSVGERLTELHASIWDTLQDDKTTTLPTSFGKVAKIR